MKKAKLNYWIDVGIGISFVLSAISGLIFLLPINWATDFNSVLGITFSLWNQLHTWSSLAMIAGVLTHLVLHWNWIVTMTKKTLLPARKPKECTTSTADNGMTRRQFLYLGSVAVLSGAILTGYWAITKRQATDTRQTDYSNDQLMTEAGQPVQQSNGVACPRGMVNDPYPGRCRHYTDRNGDGICDYSVPGSGNN